MRILLLEDDETLRELLESALLSRGFEVTAVGRGDEAIERGRAAAFDLIVADVRMEGTDGLTALGQVQNSQPGIRSIVITGYSTEADSIRAIRLGVGDYLKKPFRVGEFMEAVERQAERCRLAREVAERELELLATAIWALEQACPAGREAGQQAEQVALRLGMTPAAARETRLATLARALGQPRAMGAMQARIVSACLEEEDDPEILAAMQDVPPGGLSLLSLARALEHSGEPESARQAYHELLAGASTRERLEALLGLARLGEPERAREAVALAGQVGPLASAQTRLEAALCLAGDEAARLATEAARHLELPAAVALAELVQARWSGDPAPESWRELLAPDQVALRAELARWGMVWLLEQEAAPLLELLARESPREFSRALRAELPAPARLRAALALAGSWGPWTEEALGLLAEDPDPAVRQAARPGGVSRPPLLRILSLGPLEVLQGDTRLEDRHWKSPKVRLMLAFLAAQGGRPVSEDLLQEVFWPADPRGRRNLSATLSHLRHNLRPAGWPEELNYVVRSSQGILLNPELPRWHDLDELERAAERGAGRQVLALYRGPYLEGQYADWVLVRRTRVERLVLSALEDLLRAETDPSSQLELAERALELDPYHQDACLKMLCALVALRRPEEAVRRFEACRKRLQRDLGLEPSLELLRAYETARLT